MCRKSLDGGWAPAVRGGGEREVVSGLRMKLNEALSRNGWVGREVLDGSDDM